MYILLLNSRKTAGQPDSLPLMFASGAQRRSTTPVQKLAEIANGGKIFLAMAEASAFFL
jgi:hypothetical protein